MRTLCLERGSVVPQAQLRNADAFGIMLEVICGNSAIQDLCLCVDVEDFAFIELLENVAKAEHDNLVADDQNTPVAIMEVDRVEHRSEAEDHIGPALAARRPMIEFAEAPPVRSFFRKAVADPCGSEPVEDPELALA